MHTIENLNKNFGLCCLKNWDYLTGEQELLLKKRTKLLNDQFEFTDKAIKKIRKVNNTLTKLEERLRKFLTVLGESHKEWIKQDLIDDSYFEIVIRCYNDDKYYSQLHDELTLPGPFYMSRISNSDIETWLSKRQNTNYNKFASKPDHALASDIHCYTFRYLYQDSFLSWEDIARADWLFIDIDSNYLI